MIIFDHSSDNDFLRNLFICNLNYKQNYYTIGKESIEKKKNERTESLYVVILKTYMQENR